MHGQGTNMEMVTKHIEQKSCVFVWMYKRDFSFHLVHIIESLPVENSEKELVEFEYPGDKPKYDKGEAFNKHINYPCVSDIDEQAK
ncbi:hypothetical protein ACJX0J_006715, partial [Zea mays]